MGIREHIQQHQTAAVLGAGAALAAAVGLVVYFARTPSWDQPREAKAYFYDQNTQTLFVARDQPGLIVTGSGPYEGEPAGVRAHVFACGPCADEAHRFIGWLSKPAPPAEGTNALPSDRELIRRPRDRTWVLSDSAEGGRIFREVHQRCQRGPALKYCHPEPDRQP